MIQQAARPFRLRVNLLTKILAATLVAALVPLAILSLVAYQEAQRARDDTTTIARSGLDDQALSTLKMQAVLVAGQISQLLASAVTDTRSVAGLPRETPYFLAFYRSHTGNLLLPDGANNGHTVTLPLYREMAFIDATGHEQILIRNGRVVPAAQLRDVGNPKDTTYRTETYFADTQALPPRGIYISDLTAWNATNPLQPASPVALAGGKPRLDGAWYAEYVGVIRFATPLYDARHSFKGMVMLSLDARFLMELVIHLIPATPNAHVVWPDFNGGSYAFVWDHQGWLIAHPLLSRLRGLDARSMLPSAGDEKQWIQKQATVAFNMHLSKYLPAQPLMYQQVAKQQVGWIQGQNAGGVQRVYVYAPIPFAVGRYRSAGVFGGVGLGTYLNTFHGAATAASNAINNRVNDLLTAERWIGILSLLFIIVLAIVVSLSLTRPLARLAHASRAMGRGQLDPASLEKIGDQFLEDEVTELAQAFKWMASQVQQREDTLRQEVAALHIQIDLKQQERQVEEITGTDWFQFLSKNAESMRSRYRTSNAPESGAGVAPPDPSGESA